jgi:hypothetical protein
VSLGCWMVARSGLAPLRQTRRAGQAVHHHSISFQGPHQLSRGRRGHQVDLDFSVGSTMRGRRASLNRRALGLLIGLCSPRGPIIVLLGCLQLSICPPTIALHTLDSSPLHYLRLLPEQLFPQLQQFFNAAPLSCLVERRREMTSLFLLKYPEGKPATAAPQATHRGHAAYCPNVPAGKGKRIHHDAQHLASRHWRIMI